MSTKITDADKCQSDLVAALDNFLKIYFSGGNSDQALKAFANLVKRALEQGFSIQITGKNRRTRTLRPGRMADYYNPIVLSSIMKLHVEGAGAFLELNNQLVKCDEDANDGRSIFRA